MRQKSNTATMYLTTPDTWSNSTRGQAGSCTDCTHMHQALKCGCSNLMYLTALRPKAMPSSGPRLMVVLAKRRAGACTLRAFTRLVLPFPLLAKYTEACRQYSVAVLHCSQALLISTSLCSCKLMHVSWHDMIIHLYTCLRQ